ncbi:NEW3 domain-containing protein [Paenibacillus methanolicus]|uniref:Alpha-galactosidase-like protein n=1 Tax=Paenibacillus methanolicus TaxID=582686 RepID=A0A5S5C8P1_9BACL|nr:NEW3 domain-containing protein [Paenibacillus methanolicus]TYP74852.1 alpha-galactosidase-like protein [Paenibacillus methanolicus]
MRYACTKPTMSKALMVLLCLGCALSAAMPHQAQAAGTVELYTPYLQLSAPPGDAISYSIEAINRGESTAVADVAFDAKGNKWDYELTAGGRAVDRLAVKGGESQTLSLMLRVPLEINKGVYRFEVKAGGGTLPLAVVVSEQGTFRTELETEQPNMQGHSDSTFSYTATIRNRTAEKQTYALNAQAEPGWDVSFADGGGTNVTSVEVEAGGEKSISISVKPPETVQAGTYKIPVAATNNASSAETTFEAVVTGTYALSLSTPNDLLSTDVTAGSERKLDLTLDNTGSAELANVSLSADSPTGWEVTFEPSAVESIKPGETARVQATIKADKKALAGDYVVNVTASAPEKSASAQFRVAVETSVLWGWIGILIIVLVGAGIYYLFRKYGRR